MGIFDWAEDFAEAAVGRTWDAASGIGEGVLQIPLFAYDMALSVGGRGQYDDPLEALWTGGLDRVGNVLENTIGPERGVGAILGGIPEPIRHPFALGFEATNKVYKEVIDQPIATLANVINLVDTGKGFWDWDPGAFFNPDTWSKAYDLSEDISFGQAVILGIVTDNILDPEEVRRAQGTDFYQFASLGLDLAVAWNLDPLAIVGRAVKIGREVDQLRKGGGALLEAQKVPKKMELAYKADRAIKDAEQALLRGEEVANMPRSLTRMEKFRLGRNDKIARMLEASPISFARYADAPSLSQRIARRLYPNMNWDDMSAGAQARQAEKAGVGNKLYDWFDENIAKPMRADNPNASREVQQNILSGGMRQTFLSQVDYRSSNPAVESVILADAFLSGRAAFNRQIRANMGDMDVVLKQGKKLDEALHKQESIETMMYDLHQYQKQVDSILTTSFVTSKGDRTLDQFFQDLLHDSMYLSRKGQKELQKTILSEHIQPAARGAVKPRGFWAYRPVDKDWHDTLTHLLKAEFGAATDNADALSLTVRGINDSQVTRAMIANKELVPSVLFKKVPEITRGTKLRYAYKTSDLYQNSFMSKPMRVMFNMLPHKVIDHSLTTSDQQVRRMLDQTSKSIDEKNYWHGIYMREPTAQGRMAIFEEILTDVVKHVGSKTGVSDETMVDYLNRIALRRRANQAEFTRFVLPDKNSTTGFITAHGVEGTDSVAVLASEHSVLTFVPDFRRMEVEMAKRAKREQRFKDIDYSEDLKQLEKIKRQSKNVIAQAFPSMDNEGIVGSIIRSGADLLDQAQQVWVKNVLIRPAFTFRVVLGDEQVRMMAKFMGLWGTSTLGASMRQGMQNWIWHSLQNEYKIPKWLGYTHEELGRATDVRAAIAGAGMGFLFGGGLSGNLEEDPFSVLVMTALGGVGNTVLAKKLRTLKKVPYDLGLRPTGFAPAFGNETDTMDRYMRLNSSSVQSIPESFWRTSGATRAEVTSFGHFQSITPKDTRDLVRYKASWEYTANETLRQDPMAHEIMKRLIERQQATPVGELIDITGLEDEVVEWLWRTDEGRIYKNQMRTHHRSVEDSEVWARQAYDEVAKHFQYGGKQDLKDPTKTFWNSSQIQDILDGKNVSFDDFFKFNDEEIKNLPTINGASVRETLGAPKSAGRILNDSLESGMDFFARLPTDFMSRNRAFSATYEMETRRILHIMTGGSDTAVLSKSQIQSIESRARNYALAETKELLYDLAERSEFAEMMKFIMPFYPAYQEVITRYASLAVENPVWAARLHELWGAPERAPALYYTDPSTNEKYLRLRLPSFAKGLLKGALHKTFLQNAFDDQDEILLAKDSFNMITQGPGFGPFIQIPLKEIFKDNPDLQNVAEKVFPFGPPEDVIDTFLSGGEKRLLSLGQGLSSEEFSSMYNQVLQTRWTRMLKGEIPPLDFNDPKENAEFLNDVMEETKSLAHARVWATLFSPAAPRFTGPYRPYVDAWRVMREQDPEDADKNFISAFGEEYFPMTQSYTKSLAGIPPTTEAYKLSQDFADLIVEYPTYGGIITGADAGGTLKFSRFAYDRQLETPLYPGSPEHQRERYAPAELITENRTKLTWIKFSQAMDMIDAAMEERGLPNLRLKSAADLREAKSIIVQNLAAENPEWEKEYFTRDPTLWRDRITAFTAFTQNPKLMSRGDMQGLAEYLRLRSQMQLILANNGIKSIDSIQAQPFMDGYETAVQELVAQNLQFADIYHRYLDTDPVVD